MSICHACLVVLCGVVLGCSSGSDADTIFGRGGEVHWIDVPDGRLKAEIYSSTPRSAHPVVVIVLHGDLFNPTPSYQYAFAQALTQGFDAPAMPDQVRARLGVQPRIDGIVAAGSCVRGTWTTPATAPMEIEVTRAATTTPLK